MDHGELERLFSAFRDGGDVQRLGAVFDRAAPELLEIAVHLCGNVDEAEDLVQATFVVAIERAGSWDPSQRLMPWLLGILARNAARARRDAAREPDAARLNERRATEPPEASSAAETRERLASAIAALPSPYREVLERHLLDDRRAVEVAREMSRAPGTVRMQIMRGLEMLRRSLPPSVATGLLLADELRGLAAVRATVLDKAALAAKSTVVGAVSGSSVIATGALMSSKVVISLALAVSVVAGALFWRASSAKQTEPHRGLAIDSAEIPASVDERAASVDLPRATDDRRPAEDAAADPQPPRKLRGHIEPRRGTTPPCGVDGRIAVPEGQAMHDVSVALFRRTEASAPLGQPMHDVEPDADGAFVFGLRVGGSYLVVASCPGLVPASSSVMVIDGELAHVADLVLAPGPVAICGAVRWPLPVELAGVRVVAQRLGAASNETHDDGLAWSDDQLVACSQSALADANGRFCIRGLASGRYEVAIDGAPGIDHRVMLPSLEVLAPANDVVLGDNVGRIAVDVLADGAPLANAKVQVVDENGRWGAQANASGHCAFLVNATRDCTIQASDVSCSTAARSLPAAGRALDERVVLAVHRLAATDATLELLPSPGDNPSKVSAKFHQTDDAPLGWMMMRMGRQPTAELDLGVYTFAQLNPGRYRVTLEPSDGLNGNAPGGSYLRCDEFEIELKPGETLRRSIAFERGGRLRTTVENFGGGPAEQTCELFDANGQKANVWFMTFAREDDHISSGGSSSATSLDEPAETYPNLPPGRYQLRLAVSGYRAIERDVLVRAGETADVPLRLERD